MSIGPLFRREALIQPRLLKHYLQRSGYVAVLLALLYTTFRASFGFQQIRSLSEVARFGTLVFQVLAVLQLTLILFFAVLFAAGRIAQEKDRKTLILLLMTDMRDHELVLGKLTASLLNLAVLLCVSIPVFGFIQLLGGVGFRQVLWLAAICALTGFAAGSWGALVAFWRDTTFQTLAISLLGTVVFLSLTWAINTSAPGTLAGSWAGRLNPYLALFSILSPLARETALGEVAQVSALPSVAALGLLGLALNTITVLRLRVWNPPRTVSETARGEREDEAAVRTAPSRSIWNNPIIWREMRTRAYGRKIVMLKLAYLAISAAVFWMVMLSSTDAAPILGMISPNGFAFLALALFSLLLINAQAVTAFTSERDANTLELLLVTDITAREFVLGKLGGILYNTKELILVPLLMAIYYAVSGRIIWEDQIYVSGTFLVLVTFTAMLGLHCGLSYENSRTAISVSLGTMFFLSIGIFILMLLLVEARMSYMAQFGSFSVIIGIGGIGLWVALGYKIPSSALALSAFLLPFITFYAIVTFLLEGTLGVAVSIALSYGFTTLAMLVPAVSDFDVALGRTSDQG